MKRSLIPAVALSGVFALALSGCGSSASPTASSSSSTSSSPTSSSPTTSSPTTSSPSTGAAVAGDSAAALATRISDAMIKAKSGKGKISTTGGAAATNVTGTLQFSIDGATTRAQGAFTIAGMTLEIVTTGGVIYLKGLPVQMTGGKPWVKIDPKGTDALSKSMSKLGSNTGDPRALVDSLKGGTATIKGKSGGLTTYEITGATALAGGTLEVTVDDQSLPHTFKVTTSGVTVTAEYSDWGAPVAVSAPPADQVGSASVPTHTS